MNNRHVSLTPRAYPHPPHDAGGCHLRDSTAGRPAPLDDVGYPPGSMSVLRNQRPGAASLGK